MKSVLETRGSEFFRKFRDKTIMSSCAEIFESHEADDEERLSRTKKYGEGAMRKSNEERVKKIQRESRNRKSANRRREDRSVFGLI